MAFTHGIVAFPIDNSVEVLPIGWLLEGHTSCLYPPLNTDGLSSMVKKSVPRDNDWILYECRVLKLYESYKAARANLNKAEKTSDLSSNDGSRRRTATSTKPDLPLHPDVAPLAEELEERTLPDEPTEKDPPLRDPCFVLASDQVPVAGQTVEYLLQGSSVNAMSCGQSCAAHHEAVLLKIEGLEGMMRQQTELLNFLITQGPSKGQVQDSAPSWKFAVDTFPVKTKQDLEDLEKLILDNDSAKAEIKERLKLFGGGTLEDAIKSIFKFSIDDNVLSQHSLKGQSKKSSFTGYSTLYGVMFDSIRANAKYRGITLDVFDEAVAKNLKRAADRVNARKKLTPSALGTEPNTTL